MVYLWERDCSHCRFSSSRFHIQKEYKFEVSRRLLTLHSIYQFKISLNFEWKNFSRKFFIQVQNWTQTKLKKLQIWYHKKIHFDIKQIMRNKSFCNAGKKWAISICLLKNLCSFENQMFFFLYYNKRVWEENKFFFVKQTLEKVLFCHYRSLSLFFLFTNSTKTKYKNMIYQLQMMFPRANCFCEHLKT